MKDFNKKFWDSASELNIYYSYYVLPSSVLIHTLAYFFIDLNLVGDNASISLLLRVIPVTFLSLLFILIWKKNHFIINNYRIFFFLSGFLSSFPIIFHGSNDLLTNDSLFSGGMGIILLKVIMVMFVFLPKAYTYTLYFLIDALTILSYFILARDIITQHLEIFLIFMFLSDLILLIAYHVTLDLRKKNFQNQLDIANINNELKNEMEFKNRYFNLLAHDMKSPVNLMQSALNLIQSEDINENRKKEYLSKFKNQLDSLNNLIINVLDWIKTSNNKTIINKEKVDLIEVVDEVLEINSELIKQKELECRVVKSKTILQSDKTSLIIILNNLLRNALKFSNIGNIILITVNNNSFTIENEGIPFDDEQLNLFNSKKSIYIKNGSVGEKGNGLGLEIIRNLCEKNDLSMNIKNDMNKTKITINF